MNQDENTNSSAPEETEFTDYARLRRQRNWKIFGWTVIGLMAAVIILNYVVMVEPILNQVAIAVLFLSYVVYVIFRKR